MCIAHILKISINLNIIKNAEKDNGFSSKDHSSIILVRLG